MKLRRGLIAALLTYVTLDLSLPTMPGAFVFEPADSIESIRINRGRGAAEVVLLPTPEPAQRVVSGPRPDDVTDRTRAPVPAAPGGHRLVNQLPRAALDSAPPSEDPHEPSPPA